MARHPAATRADHLRFCELEGWSEVRSGSGSRSHHQTFELPLSDGRILRTRISHPPGRQTYGASIWSHILRDQLGVTPDEFWACVAQGILPLRSASEPEAVSIPADLVHLLIHSVGLSEDEVRAMSKDEAVKRATEFWSTS
ncbi:MAG TPA: hypothetical protein VIJ34_07455 [Acidimicrobiales bacterium]